MAEEKRYLVSALVIGPTGKSGVQEVPQVKSYMWSEYGLFTCESVDGTVTLFSPRNYAMIEIRIDESHLADTEALKDE